MNDALKSTSGDRTRPRSPIRKVVVEKVMRLTPGLTRVTFAGAELAGFGPPRPAAHIKLHMVPLGESWNPLDEDAPRPPRRTYTPRSFDSAALTLDVDFVLHGHGLASDWAAQTKPGQTMFVSGPGGGYEAPADARTLVLVADETALPAVGMILETLPATCRPIVLAEVPGPEEVRALSDHVTVAPRWLHRDTARSVPGSLLEDAVAKLDVDSGAAWWVACEAASMRRIKHHLLKNRAIAPTLVHVRGYWKLGETAYPDHDYGKD